jgi:hypothetical protein
MLRRKGTFRIEHIDSQLRVMAALVRGAQIGRKDRLVFSRSAVLQVSDPLSYKVSLKISHSGFQGNRFVSAMKECNLKGALGYVQVSVASGVLDVQIPITDGHRSEWIQARSGNTYTVIHFTLPTDFRLSGGSTGEFLANLSIIRRDTNVANRSERK